MTLQEYGRRSDLAQRWLDRRLRPAAAAYRNGYITAGEFLAEVDEDCQIWGLYQHYLRQQVLTG